MPKAPQKEALLVPGPQGDLEALLETPADASQAYVAILCHPHPQHQGTMLNKVVHTLARAMHDLRIPSLRFNFRGVGSSQGHYGEGAGEVEDVVAVAAYARQRWPNARLCLGGFSFGGVVAARAAQEVQPAYLISIAPAVNILGRELHSPPAMPWLIVQGAADQIVPCEEVVNWAARQDPAPDLVVMPDVDHFFHGHLVDLRSILVNQLQKALE